MAKLENVNIEIDGVKYRKVDRAANVGDVVRITDDDADDCDYLTNGGFYEVKYVDSWGDPQVTDDDGDEFDLAGWQYEVYEKRRPTVGDYVKVTNRENPFVGHNYEVGSVVKIVVDNKDHQPYRTENANGTVGNWLYESEVEPATEAEFLAQRTDEEVRQKTSEQRIPVGSIVRITVDTEDLPKGAIAKVTRDDLDCKPYRCELLDGSDYDYYRADQIEVLSEEEAKWAVLGRKVNEYKNGDIVKIVANSNHSVNKVGSYGIITEVDIGEDGVHYRVDTGVSNRCNWTYQDDMVLVAPVESRVDCVDIAGGDAK